jgi:hypothetical protein
MFGRFLSTLDNVTRFASQTLGAVRTDRRLLKLGSLIR